MNHKWSFSEITGITLPDELGSGDAILNGATFTAHLYNNGQWFSNDISSTARLRVPNANISDLDDLNEFTFHIYGNNVSTISSDQTMLSRGSLSGWSASIDASAEKFKWSQTGQPDILSSSANLHGEHFNLFTVRRKDDITSLWINGEFETSGTGAALPSDANSFDLILLNREPTPSDLGGKFSMCNDITLFDYGQEDIEISNYYRGLSIVKPIIRSISHSTSGDPSSSIVLPLPFGARKDDLLIAAISIIPNTLGGGTIDMTGPTGWTFAIPNINDKDKVRLYYKNITDNEPEDYTWDLDRSGDIGGIILAIKGVGVVSDNYAPFLIEDDDTIAGNLNSANYFFSKPNAVETDLVVQIDTLLPERTYTGITVTEFISTDTDGEVYYFNQNEGRTFWVLTGNHTSIAEFNLSTIDDDLSFGRRTSISVAIGGYNGSFFENEILQGSHKGMFNSIVGL